VAIVVAGVEGIDGHETGPGHPECPARVGAAAAGVSDARLGSELVAVEGRQATRAELERVHGAAYLDALERFCAAGGGRLDPDTVTVPGSWPTALAAAGAGLVAIEALERGDADGAFVIARPPGHHAGRDRAMGFCLLNNIAVAAAALVAGGRRVMIVDWDVHHGNGTQEIFWDEPGVLYLSTHQAPHYPGTGSLAETGGPLARGLTINVPLPAGTTGDAIRMAVDELAAPAAERFGADWVLVSAGFDAHRDDPLADMLLTAGDFADLTRRVTSLVPVGRTVLFLEGGYDLGALRRCVAASVSALAGGDVMPEPTSSGGPGTGVVAAAKRIHDRQGGPGW